MVVIARSVRFVLVRSKNKLSGTRHQVWTRLGVTHLSLNFSDFVLLFIIKTKDESFLFLNFFLNE